MPQGRCVWSFRLKLALQIQDEAQGEVYRLDCPDCFIIRRVYIFGYEFVIIQSG